MGINDNDKPKRYMNKTNGNSKNDRDKRGQNTDSENRQRTLDLRHWLRAIAIASGILLIIIAGLVIGLFVRLSNEPRRERYRLDGFSVSLPVEPEEMEITGLPPFSNRRLIKYETAVSRVVSYQILVMDAKNGDAAPTRSGGGDGEEKWRINEIDTEMEQWATATIGVLCAAENHSIGRDCLKPGSRLTRWHLITGEGVVIRGAITKSRRGKFIQMLAIGTTGEEAAEFFDSFKTE